MASEQAALEPSTLAPLNWFTRHPNLSIEDLLARGENTDQKQQVVQAVEAAAIGRNYGNDDLAIETHPPEVTVTRLSVRSEDKHSVRPAPSTASTNNPKLLSEVEDAIRRFILPELDALKEEQRMHKRQEALTRESQELAQSQEQRAKQRSKRMTGKLKEPSPGNGTRSARRVQERKSSREITREWVNEQKSRKPELREAKSQEPELQEQTETKRATSVILPEELVPLRSVATFGIFQELAQISQKRKSQVSKSSAPAKNQEQRSREKPSRGGGDGNREPMRKLQEPESQESNAQKPQTQELETQGLDLQESQSQESESEKPDSEMPQSQEGKSQEPTKKKERRSSRGTGSRGGERSWEPWKLRPSRWTSSRAREGSDEPTWNSQKLESQKLESLEPEAQEPESEKPDSPEQESQEPKSLEPKSQEPAKNQQQRSSRRSDYGGEERNWEPTRKSQKLGSQEPESQERQPQEPAKVQKYRTRRMLKHRSRVLEHARKRRVLDSKRSDFELHRLLRDEKRKDMEEDESSFIEELELERAQGKLDGEWEEEDDVLFEYQMNFMRDEQRDRLVYEMEWHRAEMERTERQFRELGF
ncbi:hypothetical protein EJ06DRAFT_254740 [Trichodelitschia bisporula]|uniref:Uncharacterized protein n=1 Tax=Trichodelitschia bisporula TaxID=703511 RepID=A0A6G1HJV7_9PEZI|nr:hypothetical protein EJ06DRAFT_254740 [Trichodelitschia bisporula]